MRNDGPKINPFVEIADGPSSVEVDGKSYNRCAPMSHKREWKLKSGDEVDEAIVVKLADFMAPGKDGREHLVLTPGRHTLQVHLFAYPIQANVPPVVEVLSNEVEFEVPTQASSSKMTSPPVTNTAQGGKVVVSTPGGQLVTERIELGTPAAKSPSTNAAAGTADRTLAEQPPVVVETLPVSGARDVAPGNGKSACGSASQ